MKPFPSIRSRLLLILLGLGVCLTALAGFLYRTTESLFYQGLQSELRGDLDWLASIVGHDSALLRPPRADSLCKAVSRFKGYRVTVVDSNGRVLGDSHVPADSIAEIENHAYRPEILEARRASYGSARRFSHTVGMEMLYVARMTTDGMVLRMAAGSGTLRKFRGEAARFLFWILLLFLAAAGILILWISRRISAPLLKLTVDARDIGKPLRWDARLREAEVLNQAFNEYVDAIRKLATNLKEEHAHLSAVLNRLEEGIVLLSAEGRVSAVNPAARRLLPSEFSGGEWEGRPFSEVVSHPGLRAFAVEAGNPLRPPFFQTDRGPDSPFDLLCHLRGVGGSAGEYLLTVANVTEFRNLDRAKSDFVANASHELKTPLSSILGYSESLLDGALEKTETREPFVRKIHENAQRLQRLVQDLLSLSQLESQPKPLRAEKLPVRAYVHAASQLNRTEMEAQGIRFESHVPEGLCFQMEPKDLELICNNLIGNAVRYNRPGGKIKISWDEEVRKLIVKDTGIGIAPEMLPRVFERFYRADASRARKEGTGLGLAIVKHAAQRYGVSVEVESKIGEGSEFTLMIPEETLVRI